jgi:tetratricopeptide (TPR) repeat protein
MKQFIAISSLIALFLLSGCISPELRTARIAMNERDWSRALAGADAELIRGGPAAEPYFIKGRCYEQMTLWVQMVACYDSAVALDSTYKEPVIKSRRRLMAKYWQMSVDSSKVGNIDWAMALADTAALFISTEPGIYQHTAIIAYNATRLEDAIKYSLKAIEKEPVDTADLSSREVLMLCYSRLQKYDDSRKWAEDLLRRIDAKTDTISYLRAHDAVIEALELAEDYSGAIKAIREAIAVYPTRIDLQMNLALMYLRIKDFDAAQVVYTDLVKVAPDNFDANLNLGTILVNQDKWEQSIPYLKKAYELDPKNITAVTNLMAAYYNSGKPKDGETIRKQLEKLQKGQ